MVRWIDVVGAAVDCPESAWDALAPHKATRLASIALGLAAFSRLVIIILDVHRLAFGSTLDEHALGILLGTLDRGSIWHSLVIAACGQAVILGSCAITTISIASVDRHKYASVFGDIIAATTIRTPIIAGSTLVALFLMGNVYVAEAPVSLWIWIAGFALAMLETWRASGKVAARHGVRPRAGIIASLLSSVTLVAAAVGIIYLMGGLD